MKFSNFKLISRKLGSGSSDNMTTATVDVEKGFFKWKKKVNISIYNLHLDITYAPDWRTEYNGKGVGAFSDTLKEAIEVLAAKQKVPVTQLKTEDEL